jgi:hypothetical protein
MNQSIQQQEINIRKNQSMQKEPAGNEQFHAQQKNSLHPPTDKKKEQVKKLYSREDMPLL